MALKLVVLISQLDNSYGLSWLPQMNVMEIRRGDVRESTL